MNVNLAPVLGVLRPPADGSFLGQFGRTYGPNPRQVGNLAARLIRAQQRQGVAATLKHFPGDQCRDAAGDYQQRALSGPRPPPSRDALAADHRGRAEGAGADLLLYSAQDVSKATAS
jgi:beta-N-acetylhexosaminidase